MVKALFMLMVFVSLGGLMPASAQGTNPFAPWSDQRNPGAPAQGPGAPNIGNAPAHTANTTVPALFENLSLNDLPLRVNLWFPGVTLLSETEIAQGSAAAQAIALRVGDRPVIVSTSNGITPGALNLVIGDIHQLRGMLTSSEAAAVVNGYLLLRQTGHLADTQTLLITGRTAAGVNSAILTLGMLRVKPDERLPNSPSTAIRQVILPKAPTFLRREPLHSGSPHTFKELLDMGVSMRMTDGSGVFHMEFNLPGDFSNEVDDAIELELHYENVAAHAMRGAERVSVKVNGKDGESRIATTMTAPDGRRQARADLPLSLFNRGVNRVEVTFHSSIGHTSEPVKLFMDSALVLPPSTVPPVLPDLEIASKTVYPLVGQPNGSEIVVYIADRSLETIESMWTLMAKLAQVSNTLLYAVEYTFNYTKTNRHLVTVGTRQNLPRVISNLIPILVFEDPPAPLKRDLQGTNLKKAIKNFQERRSKPDAQEIDKEAPIWIKAERGYMACSPPVEDQRGWLLLLTAESPAQLRERANQIVLPAYWNRLAGSSMFWVDTPDSLTAYREREQQELAGIVLGLPETEVEMPLGERFGFRRWVIAAGLTIFVFILSALYSIGRVHTMRGHRLS